MNKFIPSVWAAKNLINIPSKKSWPAYSIYGARATYKKLYV